MTPWTIALQTPLSLGFPRQAYWSGLPFPFTGDLSDPGIKPRSPALQSDSLPAEAQIRDAFHIFHIQRAVAAQALEGLEELLHVQGQEGRW